MIFNFFISTNRIFNKLARAANHRITNFTFFFFTLNVILHGFFGSHPAVAVSAQTGSPSYFLRLAPGRGSILKAAVHDNRGFVRAGLGVVVEGLLGC